MVRNFNCLVIILPLLCQAQSIPNKSDSLSKFPKSIGYGLSNVLEIATQNATYRPQFYIDLSAVNSKGFYYRVGLSANYRTFVNGNLRQHELIPFNFTIGGEKYWYKNNLYLVLGADLFYSMSVRKVRLSTFQLDDYGLGVAPSAAVGFILRENLAIHVQYEAGLGYFRDFVGVGTIAAQTLVPRIIVLRNISLGMRHYF